MKHNQSKPRVALVTGASAGMGKEFAKALIAEGMVVYTAARRVEQMDDLKAAGAIPLKMDITNEEQVQALVARIENDHGGVDVLINNAGFGMFGAMEDTSIDDARYQFEVNIFGLARLTQLLIPSMRGKKAGTIINISSMGGKVYFPLGAWYHATKHALEGWSDCLRVELAQFGINVVVIEPGAINTEFSDVMSGPMLERSGNTVYSKLANKLAESIETTVNNTSASTNPQVITNLIIKAVRAKKPKTRYAAGLYAKPMMFIRKWFGDRVYDKMLFAMYKTN